MIFSEPHITQDPESPKAWALPLLSAVGNDVSPLTMAVLCERLWNVCHVRRDGHRVREKEIDLSPQVFEPLFKLYCPFFHSSPLSQCLMQAPLSSKTPSISQRALKAEGCLWKTGYPRSGTPTLPFLPGLLTPILSMRSVVLLGRCREERRKTGQQEAEGPPRRSRGQHLILPPTQASIVRMEEKCVHTSSVYFLHDLVYWALIYGSSTCACNIQESWLQACFNTTQRLFVTHWYDNEWGKVGTTIETEPSYFCL